MRVLGLLATSFLLLVLLIPASASAVTYDMYLWSTDYQPGHVIYVNMTGQANMSVSIKITDDAKDIVAGRDAILDVSGNYSFDWSPSQEGNYNVTVTFATGLSITRPVLIQSKVTPIQIGEIYRSIFGVESRLTALIKDQGGLVVGALALGGIAVAISSYMGWYVKKKASPAETEFERFLKSDVEGVLGKFLEKGK